jgi:UDP-N-acetylglucosamine 4,6-dehydratase/5-epimerase
MKAVPITGRLAIRIYNEKYLRHFSACEVLQGFKYNSGTNREWVDEEALRSLICQYVDPQFEPRI